MKETTRLLELIKYFTLVKRSIRFTANADATIREITNSKYTKKSGYFNIESIILDYGSDYFSSLQEKEQHIFFGKCPINISGNYEIPKGASELMTPAITHDYVQLGKSFKRYIFPSTTDNTYTQKYKSYNEWHDKTLVDPHQNYYRTRSFNILIEQNSVDSFNSFLNESYSQWKTRFDQAKEDAKSGNFYYFSLFDPRIYKYELTFTDRIRILEYMIYLMDWPIFGDRDNVDVNELFTSLINNTNSTDSVMFYNYMFQVNPLTGKTYLQDYKNKLSNKLYSLLIFELMRSFYETKTIKELSEGFAENLLYPIGFLDEFNIIGVHYLDLDDKNAKIETLIKSKRGIEYNIELINIDRLKIHIISAYQYQFNYPKGRVDYKKCSFGDGQTILNFDDIIYISPYFMDTDFKGLNIPYGCIIPIPAFALENFINQNNNEESIIDFIGKIAVLAGAVFPIFNYFGGILKYYNAIGVGITVIGNIFNSGLKNQIEKYDNSKSTPGHPSTNAQIFFSLYYLFSSLYVSSGIVYSILKEENKIKTLLEVENLLGAYASISDFESFMTEFHPEENLEIFNKIKIEMNQLQKEYNKFKYLKNIK